MYINLWGGGIPEMLGGFFLIKISCTYMTALSSDIQNRISDQYSTSRSWIPCMYMYTQDLHNNPEVSELRYRKRNAQAN